MVFVFSLKSLFGPNKLLWHHRSLSLSFPRDWQQASLSSLYVQICFIQTQFNPDCENIKSGEISLCIPVIYCRFQPLSLSLCLSLSLSAQQEAINRAQPRVPFTSRLYRALKTEEGRRGGVQRGLINGLDAAPDVTVLWAHTSLRVDIDPVALW